MTAAAGYSGTPLSKKLGIKPGARVCALGEPADYRSLLEPLPERVAFTRTMSPEVGLTHIFATGLADLTKVLQQARKSMRPDAMVWVSWPKKSAKVPTDITEDRIREVALPMGFVDVKVCAVTDVWSGLKLVIRKELRP
jgi:hypothetical protein